MQLKNNTIDLKVGDVFRFNRARKHNTVINEFDYKGEKFMVYIDDAQYPSMKIARKETLCGVYHYYGNFVDCIVEVNGTQVRGLGGKLLDTSKPVKEKVKKDPEPKKELTDFQKFFNVQCSGKINMTNVYEGARLSGLSVDKYEDILFHYDEYKSGKRQ